MVRFTCAAAAMLATGSSAYNMAVPAHTVATSAWSSAASRSAPVLLRIKNAASEDAAGFTGQVSKRFQQEDEGTATAKEAATSKSKRINPDEPDLTSADETFAALCRMCGVPDDDNAEVDFDGFVLAFEQLFTGGMPLDPDVADELRAAIGCDGTEYDVSKSKWDAFHAAWSKETRMDSVLVAKANTKRLLAKAQAETRKAEERASKRAEEREVQFAATLAKANEKLRLAKEEMIKKQQQQGPTLLADEVKEKKKLTGKWFEERESAAKAAAQYRSLDPEQWFKVTEGVGGLQDALEEIRRRVWTPLCAPQVLLDELGTERVKGVLLYGPPGCGKSYLASRLANGLSRRPVTVVSGPEIMDKYIGGSEATLRKLFTTPPPVPHRPGDAEDVMMIAEANELHVIVLDEFDAIARQRGDGQGKGSDSAARDSVVNQLLVLMDGVAALPVPTFVLALTNRRELLDSAILRPGRLEVQVEVGKPDEGGRAAIIRIHAEKMRESGRLGLDQPALPFDEEDGCVLERVDDSTYDAWVQAMAERTEGFSGAALAAVVRAAVARALDRAVNADDTQGCRVTGGDFDKAIADVKSSQLELSLLEESEDEPTFWGGN